MEYIEGPGPITTVRTLGGPGSTARQATEWKFLPRSIPHHTQFGSRPLPRIGSLVLDQHGTVQLSNRPSNFRLQQLENKSVPTDIDRDTTYESTEVYYCSLLACHDNRIFHQANSILSPSDGQAQLAVLAAMRALLPNYATRHFRDGPFFFNLTDVHPNNVFVDADWRIKCLIDLEWACVRPVEMLSAPVWVTGKCVDQLPPGEDLDPYHVILEEFFDAFDREQGSLSPLQNRDVSLTTDMMRRGFETGHFWFYHALDNPKVACNLFFQHILRMFAGAISENSMAGFNGYSAPFWKKDSKEIIK